MKPFEIALSEFGTKGVTGLLSSPEVLKYFKDIGHAWVTDDDTAWCAAFVNWCLLKARYQTTGKLNARSFLQYGYSTKTPTLGDIVVLWRVSKDSVYGHVGFYVRQTKTMIYILGGNQSNEVNITAFPKEKLLDFRKF